MKVSAFLAARESAPEPEVLDLELWIRGREELPGVGQQPRSRSVAVAATISSSSSADGPEGSPPDPES